MDTLTTVARKKTQPDFEQTLAELEGLVEKMEQGDMPLEASLASFERGIELIRTCQQALSEAEQKVEQLLEKDGEPVPLERDEG